MKLKTKTDGKNGFTIKPIILAAAVLAGSMSLLYAMVVTATKPTIQPAAAPKTTTTTRTVSLTSLRFSQNTDFTDDYDTKVETGVQYWTPHAKTSALYTKECGKVVVTAHLKISSAFSKDRSMSIRGVADNGFILFKRFTFPKNKTTFDVCCIESDKKFGDKFDIIKSIAWTISGSGTTCTATTDNNIYYLPPGTPSSSTEREDTVMYVVCNAMKEKPYKDANAVYAVWGIFSGMNVICQDRTHTLYYWKVSENENDDGERTTTMELLDPRHRSGQCSAWANFLIDCGNLAGANKYFKKQVTLIPNDGSPYIYMKNQGWNPAKDNGTFYGCDPYRYKNLIDFVKYSGGHSITCQGLRQPVFQAFANHVIVSGLHDSIYWDPNYAKYGTNALEIENQEVDATKVNEIYRRKSKNMSMPFLQVQ